MCMLCKSGSVLLVVAGVAAAVFFVSYNGDKAPDVSVVSVSSESEETVGLLNKALADEWLAYYQYWVGALVIKGPLKGEVIKELRQHAEDELRHAKMVAERIIQLGGIPVLEPREWYTLSTCGYEAPVDPYVKRILLQNIKGEQCAIDVYQKLAKLTKGSDAVTYDMVQEILKDEIEHEKDLQELLKQLAM